MAVTISIIVPVYNAGRYLRETLQTVEEQTLTEWEMLLIDDGSTDDSIGIAREFVARHGDRARYLQHPGHANRGQFAARVLGAQHARAEVLALLDADDLWDRDYLEKHLIVWRAAAAHGAAISYGPSRYWFPEAPEGEKDFIQPMPPGAPRMFAPAELLQHFWDAQYGNTPCPSCTFLRRELFTGLAHLEKRAKVSKAYEDQILWWHLAARWSVSVHLQPWVRYRQNPSSSTGSLAGIETARRRAERSFLRVVCHDMARVCPDHHLLRSGVLHAKLVKLSVIRSFAGAISWRVRHISYAFRRSIDRVACVFRTDRRGHGRWSFLADRVRCRLLYRLVQAKVEQPSGTPIVRYYWAHFLDRHRRDIAGRGLEIGTTATIRAYGGNALRQADAIDLTPCSPEVTVVADLSRAESVPSNTYDCFVNQFTMHVVYDVEAALYHSIRMLKPGGVLLANFSCIDYYFARGLDMGTGRPLWMFWWYTPIQVENLIRRVGLSDEDYSLTTYGNLFARVAYQMRMPAEAVPAGKLELVQPGFPLIICVRIKKPADWRVNPPVYRDAWVPTVKAPCHTPLQGEYVE